MKLRNYSCSFVNCGKRYSTKYNLKKHVEHIHLGLEVYRCTLCNKVLASKQNYKQHTYTHTGETPFHCKEPGCGEQFRHGSQLSLHKKIHRAVRQAAYAPIFNVKITQLTDVVKFSSDPELNPFIKPKSELNSISPCIHLADMKQPIQQLQVLPSSNLI